MIILFALLLSLPVAATAQRLALSFDDGLDPRTQPHANAWNDALLRALAAAHLRSIAKQKGKVGLRYPAEDDVYEKPLLDAVDPDLRAGRSSPRR